MRAEASRLLSPDNEIRPATPPPRWETLISRYSLVPVQSQDAADRRDLNEMSSQKGPGPTTETTATARDVFETARNSFDMSGPDIGMARPSAFNDRSPVDASGPASTITDSSDPGTITRGYFCDGVGHLLAVGIPCSDALHHRFLIKLCRLDCERQKPACFWKRKLNMKYCTTLQDHIAHIDELIPQFLLSPPNSSMGQHRGSTFAGPVERTAEGTSLASGIRQGRSRDTLCRDTPHDHIPADPRRLSDSTLEKVARTFAEGIPAAGSCPGIARTANDSPQKDKQEIHSFRTLHHDSKSDYGSTAEGSSGQSVCGPQEGTFPNAGPTTTKPGEDRARSAVVDARPRPHQELMVNPRPNVNRVPRNPPDTTLEGFTVTRPGVTTAMHPIDDANPPPPGTLGNRIIQPPGENSLLVRADLSAIPSTQHAEKAPVLCRETFDPMGHVHLRRFKCHDGDQHETWVKFEEYLALRWEGLYGKKPNILDKLVGSCFGAKCSCGVAMKKAIKRADKEAKRFDRQTLKSHIVR